MLGTAACLAGSDGTKSEQLPDTTGMKSEVLIQAGHRYKYDRQVAMTGAKLIEVGSANGTRADQFEQALGENTAMVIHPAHLDGKPGTLSLEQIAAIAHKRGVPVFVDAAFMNYPTDLMAGYLKRGGDMVAISAKYFGGPNAGGFILARKDLIPAIANVHFTRYESGKYLKYGRPLKMDRQTIIARGGGAGGMAEDRSQGALRQLRAPGRSAQGQAAGPSRSRPCAHVLHHG